MLGEMNKAVKYGMIGIPMLSERNTSKIWLASLTGRLSVFFFINTFILLALFLIGNFQEFLDSTQEMLLALIRISSFLCGVISLYYAFMLVISMIHGRRTYLLRFLFSISAASLGFLLTAGITLILSWLGPLN